jgi:hypothetical protein
MRIFQQLLGARRGGAELDDKPNHPLRISTNSATAIIAGIKLRTGKRPQQALVPFRRHNTPNGEHGRGDGIGSASIPCIAAS